MAHACSVLTSMDATGILAAGGAVDALERLLTTHLTVTSSPWETPCFVSSIGLLHLHGFHTLPVPVDGGGLDPDRLDAALGRGAAPSSSPHTPTTRPAPASTLPDHASSGASCGTTLTSS